MRIALVALVLAGCASSAPPAATNTVGPEPGAAPPLSEEYRAMLESVERPFRDPATTTARLGQEAQVGDVRVRPIAILADTRCPVDLDCVHGGQIRVRVWVSGLGEREMELRQPLPIAGREPLHLVAVAPPRWHQPPPGIDVSAAPRFGFRRGLAE